MEVHFLFASKVARYRAFSSAVSLGNTQADMIDDSCVEVHGLSYDKDGIADGYDYDETCLEYCHLSGMRLHTMLMSAQP